MMRLSIQPTPQIFIKGYGILPFVKNMRKIIGRKIIKNLCGKHSKKFFC